MAKFRKKKGNGFLIGIIVYAVVILLLLVAGLALLWNFLEAYELSRPKNTIDSYVDNLSDEHIRAGTEAFLKSLDNNIRTEEESFQVILDSLDKEITYAKKSGESSETRQVYVLREEKQTIGEIVLTAGEPEQYGFSRWEVTEESFDFSHLLGQTLTVTVPEDFQVMANGNILGTDYITERGIPFSALEPFVDQIEMTGMVTYSAENYIGKLILEVIDTQGEFVVITEETDMNLYIPGCTQEEADKLDPFTEEFLARYVAFTGSSNRAITRNFTKLKEYLVPDGVLVNRLYTAIDGLSFAQSNGDTIKEIVVHGNYRVAEDRFMTDVSYTVETIGKKGAVQTTSNMRIVVQETDAGLKVEAMSAY